MKPLIYKDNVGQIHLRLAPDVGHEDAQTLRMAAQNYGFLVKRGERLEFTDFSARIRSTYACSPQRDAVLQALGCPSNEAEAQQEGAALAGGVGDHGSTEDAGDAEVEPERMRA